MMKHKIFIQVFVLSCVLLCCVYGDTTQSCVLVCCVYGDTTHSCVLVCCVYGDTTHSSDTFLNTYIDCKGLFKI